MTPEPTDRCDEPECEAPVWGKVNSVGFCQEHMESVMKRTLKAVPLKQAIETFQRLAAGKEPM